MLSSQLSLGTSRTPLMAFEYCSGPKQTVGTILAWESLDASVSILVTYQTSTYRLQKARD